MPIIQISSIENKECMQVAIYNNPNAEHQPAIASVVDTPSHVYMGSMDEEETVDPDAMSIAFANHVNDQRRGAYSIWRVRDQQYTLRIGLDTRDDLSQWYQRISSTIIKDDTLSYQDGIQYIVKIIENLSNSVIVLSGVRLSARGEMDAIVQLESAVNSFLAQVNIEAITTVSFQRLYGELIELLSLCKQTRRRIIVPTQAIIRFCKFLNINK